MPRILNIVPAHVPREALAVYEKQLGQMVSPGFEAVFTSASRGATALDSYYEMTMADAFVLEAGASAEEEGFDAVCVNSMSDSAVPALRSRLSIPVVGTAEAAISVSLQLGHRFSVVTMWKRWHVLYHKAVTSMGVEKRLASVRDVDIAPNTAELLEGKEEFVFPALKREARAAIDEDGAEVIILGSTTMHQSHEYLSKQLEVPVINPGVVAYKMAELLLQTGLAHSKLAFVSPLTLQDGVFSPQN